MAIKYITVREVRFNRERDDAEVNVSYPYIDFPVNYILKKIKF